MKLPIFLITANAAAELEPAKDIVYELEATEGRLERSNLIGSDLTLYKEWQLSVDLKLRRNQNWNGGSGHWQDGWANLFALQVDHENADDNLWHGEYGDRIPAVYINNGIRKLHICNSVNDNWNHCHNTDDVGTDWFNLKIGQREEFALGMINPFTYFDHVSNSDYNYQLLTDQADTFESFYIDADFSNDIHIGFSATTGHNDDKFEIVIGGWGGTQSVIRSKNQYPAYGHVRANHSKADFDEFKHNLKVQVSDGKIQVFTNDEIFMEWSDESIVKSELNNLLVSGGFNGYGTWDVEAYTAPPPPQSLGFRYEIFINDILEYSVINSAPKVFTNVKAEFANGIPRTANGIFRNFELSTTRPERPYQPVENRIFNLVEKFGEIMNNSNLREAQQQKLTEKFDTATYDLVMFYEILRDNPKHPCTFPPTWKTNDDEADEVDRYNRDDPCKAVDQMVNGAAKWGKIFVKNCKREAKGQDPYNLYDRVMVKVNAVGEKAKQKMQCN